MDWRGYGLINRVSAWLWWGKAGILRGKRGELRNGGMQNRTRDYWNDKVKVRNDSLSSPFLYLCLTFHHFFHSPPPNHLENADHGCTKGQCKEARRQKSEQTEVPYQQRRKGAGGREERGGEAETKEPPAEMGLCRDRKNSKGLWLKQK